MQSNLLRWGTVLGALPRILHYRQLLSGTPSNFDRLRIVNEALGPHWIFRLADIVGLDTIKTNRPSWFRFYVEDLDRLHCPLDPGAPETLAYLGKAYSDMDMAFYAGMGFDGYCLALQTPRSVDLIEKKMDFDGRYHFVPSAELKAELDVYEVSRFVPKEDYYAAYSDALAVLFGFIEGIQGANIKDDVAEAGLERIAAGCLILLCGGHHGCSKHINQEERFSAQMESLIIFKHARSIITGVTRLDEAAAPRIRAVS